jgi:hypothetical protein
VTLPSITPEVIAFPRPRGANRRRSEPFEALAVSPKRREIANAAGARGRGGARTSAERYSAAFFISG